jgi:hypothetical protein
MDNVTYRPSRAQLMTMTESEPRGTDDFVHPRDLTDEHLDVVMKRVRATTRDDARRQYNILFYERDKPAVRRELERFDAKFVAIRLRKSQL